VTDLERLAQRVDQLEGIVRGLYPLVRQLRADVDSLVAEPGWEPDPPPPLADSVPEIVQATPPPSARAADVGFGSPISAPEASSPSLASSDAPAPRRVPPAPTAPRAAPQPIASKPRIGPVSGRVVIESVFGATQQKREEKSDV